MVWIDFFTILTCYLRQKKEEELQQLFHQEIYESIWVLQFRGFRSDHGKDSDSAARMFVDPYALQVHYLT